MRTFFNAYLLPGFVFMAVVIGGGYSTGRELVEFFGSVGPRGGLAAMAVTMLVWSAVLAISFELARMTQAFDYRTFCRALLGRWWFLFEPAYFALLLLVLAVLGAAAGEIGYASFGWPKLAGVVLLMALIALLVFFGSGVIEKVLAIWALLLYVLYVVIIVWGFQAFGDRIAASYDAATVSGNWPIAGLTYAGYNLACMPAVLFAIRHARQRREAIGAGLLAGPIAMLPGVALFITMMGFHPEIQEQAVPSNFLLGKLGAPWFQHLFQIILFGILVKTGTALLHAINERVARVYHERNRGMPRMMRPAISLSAMVMAIFAAGSIGLIDLIGKGYGWLTWFFILVLVLPVLTVGAWKVFSKRV